MYPKLFAWLAMRRKYIQNEKKNKLIHLKCIKYPNEKKNRLEKVKDRLKTEKIVIIGLANNLN